MNDPLSRFSADSLLEFEFDFEDDGDDLLLDGPLPSKISKALNECGQQADGKFAPGNTCAETDPNWDNPTPEQLNRGQAIAKAISDGDAGEYMDRQMRGGVLKNGRFTPFDNKTKLRNLRKLEDALADVRADDPEAFEVYRRWSLAEMLKVKSYDDIPETMTVYRGHYLGDKTPPAVNVTHKLAIAEKFGASGVVSQYTVNKQDVIPMMESVFNEGELLVFEKGVLSNGSLKRVAVKHSKQARQEQKVNAKKNSMPIGTRVKSVEGHTGVVKYHGIGSSMVIEVTTPDGNSYTDYAAPLSDWEVAK